MRASSADQELSFPELVAVLYRRRWLVLGGLLLGGLAGIGATLAMPQVYTAETLLLLEPEAHAAPTGLASSTAALDSGAVDSQTQILASRSLAREVIDRLGLAGDPDLTRPPPGIRQLLARLTSLGGEPAPDPRADLVGRFLDRLAVRREGKSYVIGIAYQAGDADKAAHVANLVAELYRAGQLARKQESARRAQALLAEQSELARAQLDQAAARLEAFRNSTERDRGAGVGLKDGELAELSRQLVLASAARSEQEARLGQLRAALAAGRGTALDRGSTLLQNLNALKADLLRREAELAGQYGERHPKRLDVRTERAELDARIAEEEQSQLRAVENEVEGARAKERTLANSLEGLKGKALRQDDALRGAEALEHEVDLDRRLYDSLLERANATADPGIHQPDARVISEAVPPGGPSFPKPRLFVSLGGSVGLALGLLLIYLLESRERGFLDAGEIQDLLSLPTLALIPEVGAKVPPQDYVLEKPRSRYAESLRETLAALMLDRPVDGSGQVVLLTSALPDEGKSTLALSLGRLATVEGARVLAIDADLRRPSLHRLAGLKPGPGLIELLRGEADPDEVMHTDPRSGLMILASSGRLSQPTRLLTADRLGRVLELVRTRFDLVLVDAAPLAAVADPRLLAPLVDRTLLVVRQASTRRELCAQALENLRSTGAVLAGAVLSRVDPRRERRSWLKQAGPAAAHLARYYAD